MPFTRLALFAWGILTLTLTGCLDKDKDTAEPAKVAFVSFYHGSPDAPDLDILINSQRLNVLPFKYSDHSNYLSFLPGSRRIKFTPVNASNAYIDTALTFQVDKAYSLFVVDKLQQMDILVVKDSLVTPAAGNARVRIINLSPDSPEVDLASTGTSNTTLFSNLSFKEDSEFKEVTAGTYNFQIKKSGSADVVLSVPNVDLVAGRNFTLLFRGFGTPPAGNTKTLSLQVVQAQLAGN